MQPSQPMLNNRKKSDDFNSANIVMLILIDYLCNCVNQPLPAFIDTVIRQLQWIELLHERRILTYIILQTLLYKLTSLYYRGIKT